MKAIIVIFYLFLGAGLYGQCAVNLRPYAEPAAALGPASFGFFRDKFARAEIIGIGEDTHGTAEFTEMIWPLLRYAADSLGYNTLILETVYGEGRTMDAYVQGKRDDLLTILGEVNSSWRYRSREFAGLLDSIRTYNQSHGDRRITVRGCEMQYPKEGARLLNEFLTEAQSDLRLTPITSHLWKDQTIGDAANYLIELASLEKELRDNSELFIQRTSEERYRTELFQADVLRQFVSAILQNEEDYKQDLRDLYMAGNILRILENDRTTKAIYWAQNSHVGKDQQNGPADTAGRELHKALGSRYVSLRTDFGDGTFLAFPHDANTTGNWKLDSVGYGPVRPSTLSACFDSLAGSQAYLMLDVAAAVDQSKTIERYLEQPQPEMSGAGATARAEPTEQVTIWPSFDGVIYLRKSHPLTPLW